MICDRALSEGGTALPLHALIGSLLCQSGDFNTAIVHLLEARSNSPDDPVITGNLASALLSTGAADDALALLSGSVLTHDRFGALHRLRGFAAQSIGNFIEAAKAYEQSVRLRPNDWETWNNLGNARASSGDMDGAIAALRRAVALKPDNAQTRLNLARTLREAGQITGAERELRTMADLFPQDTTALGDLYGLMLERGLDDEAQLALERSLDRDPGNIGLLIALGRQQLLGFAMEDAERSFRQVLALAPSDGNAFLGLSDVLEHVRPQGLPSLLSEAESAGVGRVYIDLLRALIARRAKDYAAGLKSLKDVAVDFDPVRRWHLEGQLRDGCGEYDAAFAAYTRMNEAMAAEPTHPRQRAAELRARLRNRLQRTTSEWRETWSAPLFEPDRPSPVFLIGFPRSGTTLLDTMLMGHEDIEVMEERPVIAQIREETGGFDAIAGMDQTEVERLQRRYFELAANYAPLCEGKLLVDKSPLHILNVPLIHRLFPTARFLLALRHPADVALSCFMAKFRMNASMANFLDLPTIAEFYDLSFTVFERARALFPIDIKEVRYERIVDDPEAELRPVVDWLGLSWASGILDHQRTAERRGVITTASYAQVTEPLYRGSAGRWQKYRRHLDPIVPLLQPWIESFGYK